jgi:hypothetical protein
VLEDFALEASCPVNMYVQSQSRVKTKQGSCSGQGRDVFYRLPRLFDFGGVVVKDDNYCGSGIVIGPNHVPDLLS